MGPPGTQLAEKSVLKHADILWNWGEKSNLFSSRLCQAFFFFPNRICGTLFSAMLSSLVCFHGGHQGITEDSRIKRVIKRPRFVSCAAQVASESWRMPISHTGVQCNHI